MLGFFHRHQKSLMLILLVPALLAMGITGAVLSVLTYQSQPKAGRVFGEEIDQAEIQNLRRLFGRQGGEENLWQFYAQLQFAERNGISVSRKEVGQNALPEIEATINQGLMVEEWQKAGVTFNDPQGQALFRQLMAKYTGRKVSAQEYEKFLTDRGLSVGDYEAQQVREAKVLRLKEVLRDLGTVSPDQVWEKYQEENHLRALGLVELKAADYAPDLEAKEGSKAFVSKDQVNGYYQSRRMDYDEPRQVNLRYLGLTFAGLSNVLPEVGGIEATPEALKKLNLRENICAIGSESEHEDALLEAFWRQAAKTEVARIMDAVADEVEKGEGGEQPVDLAEVAKAVRATLNLSERIEFVQGETGLIESEGLHEVKLLDGFASERWFRISETGKTSDVLASDAGWFVIQSGEVKVERTPPFDEVEAQVRQDYVGGSKAEQKAYYEGHKDEFKQAQSYAVRWWFVPDDQADGDHDKARSILEGAIAEAKAAGDLTGKELLSSTKIKDAAKLRYGDNDEATEAQLAELPIIKVEAKNVGISPVGEFSRAFSYEGGWAVFKLVRVLAPRYQEFAEVAPEVAKKLGLERAVERAEGAAQDLLTELALKTGDELAAALKKHELSERETKAFERTATSLEGIADAARLVGEAFSSQAEIGGPFAAVIPDAAGGRVFLARVSRREDAPAEGFKAKYVELRLDLLSKTRLDYQEAELRNMLLRAKEIDAKMVDYVLGVTDGPNGENRITFRQIFLPPNRDTIEAYLDTTARGKVAAAQQKLAKGVAWATVVTEHSEHDTTRALAGTLPPLSREELTPEFGNDFVEAVFQLPLNRVSEPVKSKLGLHLVRALEQRQDGRRVLQHILVRMDPKKVPADVLAKAKQLSRAKLEEAQKKLAENVPFGEVAFDFGAQDDAYGQGQQLTVDFVTHFERGALGQYLQLDLPENHPSLDQVDWVPEAVEVTGPKGTSFQLFLCDRPDYSLGQSGLSDSRWLDRNVYHIAKATKAEIDAVREAFKAERNRIAQGDDTWHDRLKAFKKLARERSDAPTKVKDGALGLVKVEAYTHPLGEAFLRELCYKPDGTPTTAGYRSSIVESQAGFHLIEVVKVKSEKPEGKHRGQVAQRILLGTDWGGE